MHQECAAACGIFRRLAVPNDGDQEAIEDVAICQLRGELASIKSVDRHLVRRFGHK